MLQDTLTQAQEQVVAVAEQVAEVVAPVAEPAAESALGWSEMLMVALIGFLLVFWGLNFFRLNFFSFHAFTSFRVFFAFLARASVF